MASKIILDTDPGIDDAFAILYALHHPQINVLGLTTVFGNVSVELATNNALRISELSGKKVLVFSGEKKPLEREGGNLPTFIHGEDGFGNINMPLPSQKKENKKASQFIIDSINANQGEIIIVAVGPLTNLAKAVTIDPSISQKAKGIILMGGSWMAGGNISPVAEANIFNDPEAADIVFKTNWPITMVGLDVTHKVSLSKSEIVQFPSISIACGSFLEKISKFYIDFYRKTKNMDGCFFHDATALIYLTNPELFDYVEAKICISKDSLSRGQTVVCLSGKNYEHDFWKNRSNVRVLNKVKEDLVIKNYIQIVKYMA